MSDKDSQPLAAVQFFEVSSGFAGQRIDNFLLARLKGVPKSMIYRILRTGEVRVNKGRIKADYRIKGGDLIRVPPIRMRQVEAPAPLAKDLLDRLEAGIVYEDNALIVLNKPSGIAVHGGSGLNYGVIEAFRQIRPQNKEMELVHRLDRDTSGLLMIAKRRSMLRYLHEVLRNDSMDKRYMALVRGHWPDSRKQVDAPLQRSSAQADERSMEVNPAGREALTLYKVLRRFGDYATLLEASPITGRTHQIRVHALYAGHAIAGDTKYGDDEFSNEISEMGGKRLFLHACGLRVTLPDGEVLEVSAEPDEQWQTVIQQLKDAT